MWCWDSTSHRKFPKIMPSVIMMVVIIRTRPNALHQNPVRSWRSSVLHNYFTFDHLVIPVVLQIGGQGYP